MEKVVRQVVAIHAMRGKVHPLKPLSDLLLDFNGQKTREIDGPAANKSPSRFHFFQSRCVPSHFSVADGEVDWNHRKGLRLNRDDFERLRRKQLIGFPGAIQSTGRRQCSWEAAGEGIQEPRYQAESRCATP